MQYWHLHKLQTQEVLERESGRLANKADLLYANVLANRAAKVYDADTKQLLAVYLPRQLGIGMCDELTSILSAPAGTMRAQWIEEEEQCRITNAIDLDVSALPTVNLYNYLLAYIGPVVRMLHTHVDPAYERVVAITVRNMLPVPIHMDVPTADVDAWSTLVYLSDSDIEGGWLVFPQYAAAIKPKHGDVILMRSSVWHGNTPVRAVRDDSLRTMFVMVIKQRA